MGGEARAVAPAGDKSRRTARGTAKRRRLRVRLLVPLLVAGVMAFLYYQPISSYLQTRSNLAERRAEVASLRAEKIRLERRFERTTSDAALAREARRIGYVKPGERLFIVKGIARWRKQHPAAATP